MARGPSRSAFRAAAALAVVAGCAAGGAQRAFDQGNYPAAAALADDSLRVNPGDSGLLSLRQRARERSTEDGIARIRSFRASGHRDAALVEMDRVLRQVHGWGGRDGLSPATRSALDVELAAIAELAVGVVDGALGAGHPLSAEAALGQFAALWQHPELAQARDAATGKIRIKGRESCSRLQKSVIEGRPHWDLMVNRYCGHFGASAQEPAADRAPATLEITGAVKGLNANQVAALRAHVTEWVRASLWNDPLTPPGHGSLEGSVESSFRRQTVTLHVAYEDSIKSTTYGAAGSVAGLGTFGSPGGVRTPGTVGALPTVATPAPFIATTTTEMNRDFSYDAEEVRGHYGMNVIVQLDLGGPAAVTLKLKRGEETKAYDHDVTFDPAGISPRHDRVLSADEWVGSQLDRFATRVTWALNRKFVRAFCERPQYSVEEAARCVAAGPKPAAAMATLTEALGEDAEPAIALLRPPPDEPSARRTPRVKAPAKAHAGGAEDEDPIVN